MYLLAQFAQGRFPSHLVLRARHLSQEAQSAPRWSWDDMVCMSIVFVFVVVVVVVVVRYAVGRYARSCLVMVVRGSGPRLGMIVLTVYRLRKHIMRTPRLQGWRHHDDSSLDRFVIFLSLENHVSRASTISRHMGFENFEEITVQGSLTFYKKRRLRKTLPTYLHRTYLKKQWGLSNIGRYMDVILLYRMRIPRGKRRGKS